MHSGKAYKVSEFLIWTRRTIIWAVVISIVAAVLYELAGWKWIALPWTVVALLGTATAFMVGFKNTQTYNRTWEARQIWGTIVSNSRAWGVISRDFFGNNETSKELVYRHMAWLTTLRYQMRDKRKWENIDRAYNVEYKQYFKIPEEETTLEDELAKYLPKAELQQILATENKATQLMSLQSNTIRLLLDDKKIDSWKFVESQKAIKEFFDLQGRTERIKNFPYPRQYAIMNTLLVKLFCFLLPFGMLHEFDKLNDGSMGLLNGHMVWLAVPFSVLISWVFSSLEQVGESTENPFEGNANDVPISQMSRSIEIELREILGETNLPDTLPYQNNIIL